MTDIILPGSTIGVLGSGQLGRMFALAARRMGYRVATLSPDNDTPTGQVADIEVVASYDDLDAVRDFARQVDAVTFEFENIPVATVDAVAEIVPVRPSGQALHVAQNRLREKEFLAKIGVPHAPYSHVRTIDELRSALKSMNKPGILKTAGFGYDGKGQSRVYSEADLAAAWETIGGQESVLEMLVNFEREVSVVAARGIDGAFAHFGVVDNIHANHILDITTAPATVSSQAATDAVEIARTIFEALDIVGVLCVEFFVTDDGQVLVNEIAPRPHNSGHWTIDGAVTSQFEQQVRAVCGLPLGSTSMLRRAAAMAQLLGDLWPEQSATSTLPNWPAALTDPDIKLHLYGKEEARKGRKMGHLTALGNTVDDAAARVIAAREALSHEP